VAVDMPRALPASSTVKPAKYRNWTNQAAAESGRAEKEQKEAEKAAM
jgi:hypothetical protein